MLRRTVLALLSALSLLAGAAQAAEPRLEVTPFLGSVARPAWQPFTVTVTNPADAPAISGEVELHLYDPRSRYWDIGSWRRPVQLAPGESTQVTITANITDRLLPVADVNLVGGHGRGSSVIVYKKFEGMVPRPDNAIVVLNLSRDSEALRQLDNLQTGFKVSGGRLSYPTSDQNKSLAQRQASRSHSRVQVVSLAPDALPEDALGLDSVTAVYTDSTTTLTPQQKRVLESYVGAGGILVAEAAGTESLRMQGLGVTAALRPDDVEGWQNAFRTGAKRPGYMRLLNQFDQYYSSSGLVVAGSGTAPVPFVRLLLFLGAYLILLVPVQYAVLKRLDKREWAWGVTPALAIVFAVLAYGYGQRGRSRENFLNAASIVMLNAGEGRGRAFTSIGLFSPGQRSYDLGVTASGAARLHNEDSFSGPAESLVNGVATLKNLSVPMWSIKQASALSEIAIGQGIDVRRSGDKLTVTNRTGQVAHQVCQKGMLIAQRLEPGESRTVTISPWKNSSGLYYSDKATRQMRERLWSISRSALMSSNNTLTCWLDTPPVTLHLDGKVTPPKHQATLLIVYTSLN